MKIQVVVLLLLLGLSLAESERYRQLQSRQISPVLSTYNNNCPDPFELKTNPCVQGRMYLPVEGDSRKFVQCDALGRAYIVQCPQGLFYNDATTSCQQLQPQTTQMVPTLCPAQIMQSGRIHFPVSGDRTRFYACTAIGQGQILQCPLGLVWNDAVIACVLEVSQGTGALINGTNNIYLTLGQSLNPCIANQPEKGGKFYFPHPDVTKFIQCDVVGHAFVMSCPGGLIWNQSVTTCDWPPVNGFVQVK